MGTTAEKLQKILESKAAIKAAIEGKGVSDVGDVLSAYAGKIEAIKTGSDIKNQDKVVEITQNGQEVVTADEGFTGLGKVTVNTNVPSSGGGVQGQLYLKEGVEDSFESKYEIKSVVLPDNMDNVVTLYSCFGSYKNLTSISLPSLPNVTNMNNCFSGCSSLTSISLPSLPKVTSIANCFIGCSSLTSISLPELPNLTNIGSCFSGCSSLTSISLPSLPKVMNMYACFYKDISLVSISLPSLLTATNMGSCFSGCTSLQDLSISALPDINLTNWGVNTCTALIRNSLMNILNALPETTSSRVCTLGATNLSKLDGDDIALATFKGWTLN